MILDSGDDPCRNYRTIHRVVPEPIGVDVQVLNTWAWVNTYRYIFIGLFTSINPSSFGVH